MASETIRMTNERESFGRNLTWKVIGDDEPMRYRRGRRRGKDFWPEDGGGEKGGGGGREERRECSV